MIGRTAPIPDNILDHIRVLVSREHAEAYMAPSWWDKTDRELRVVTVRNGLLEKQMDAVKYRDASNAAEIRRLQGELAASQAEARRFAEECGRLRDRLAQCEGWPES